MYIDQNQRVSVVIPAYNAAGTIRMTLITALAQSHWNLEIIVVDDGSTDKTADVVEEIVAKDRRIRLIRMSNGGVAAARNRGIKEACGAFVAILDADDIWHPKKIAKQLAVFRTGASRLGLVYCWYREIDEAGRIISNAIFPPYIGDVYAPLILSNFIGGGSAALIRRSCLEEVSGFDTSLRDRGAQGSEDTKLFLAIAERYDFGLVPEFLMGYRRTSGNMSQDVSQMSRSKMFVLSEARSRHPELPRRLFRWAQGESHLWLATESLYSGRFWPALALLIRTLLCDPAAVCRQSTVCALRDGIRIILQSVNRSSWIGHPPESIPPGPDFLTVEPDWGIRGVFKLERTSRPSSFARRQARAASWRIKRKS